MAACMCNIESVKTQAREDAQKTTQSQTLGTFIWHTKFSTKKFSYNYLLPIHMKRIKKKKTNNNNNKNEIKSKISLSTASKQEL